MSKRLLILALLLVAAGCLWKSYEQIMRVHVDVVSGMSVKAASQAEAGRRPGPSEVTELLYPLARARQFARQYRGESERASYRAFASLLDRYERTVRAIDVARVDEQRWAELSLRLPAERAAIEAAAVEVRDALSAEARHERP